MVYINRIKRGKAVRVNVCDIALPAVEAEPTPEQRRQAAVALDYRLLSDSIRADGGTLEPSDCYRETRDGRTVYYPAIPPLDPLPIDPALPASLQGTPEHVNCPGLFVVDLLPHRRPLAFIGTSAGCIVVAGMRLHGHDDSLHWIDPAKIVPHVPKTLAALVEPSPSDGAAPSGRAVA